MNIKTVICLVGSRFKDGSQSFLFEFIDSPLPAIGEHLEFNKIISECEHEKCLVKVIRIERHLGHIKCGIGGYADKDYCLQTPMISILCERVK